MIYLSGTHILLRYQVHHNENCKQTDPLPAKHLHVIEIYQIPPGIQVEMIENIPVSTGKLEVRVCT